jgi:hypothetical protein
VRRADACGRLTTLPALALAATLALAHTPRAAAATVTFDAERSGAAIEIRATAVLKADRSTAWCVLTDYSRYTEFIPELRTSRVLSRRGAIVTVEQTGDATLGPFRMPLDVIFEITERPPDSLRSRTVAGSLRAVESRYELTAIGEGVRLDYSGRVDPGFDLLGPVEHLAAERNMERQFHALADEIERRAAGAARAAVLRGLNSEASECIAPTAALPKNAGARPLATELRRP